MIYDCVTFFNELDLLEIRLNVLKDVVDRFVIVEAGETHTGHAKPFHFEENRSRYAEFADRIIYRKIERFPAGHDAWWNENYQRNEIMSALADAKDDDRVLISDLDEIPSPEKVRECAAKRGVFAFDERQYAFYLNFRDYRTPELPTTKMLSVGDLRTGFDGVDTFYNEFLPEALNCGTTVTKIRRRAFPSAKGGERLVRGGGWHFTCLGGAKRMLEKMRAVAPHHDFDPESPELTEEKVAALLSEGHGPALRMNCFAVPVDETFPRYVQTAKGKFPHLYFEYTPEYAAKVRFRRFCRWLEGRVIRFAESTCPVRLHEWLHEVKMKMLGK